MIVRPPIDRGLVLAAAAAGAVVFAGVGRAEEPAPKPWFEEVAIDGFLSTSYAYNFGRPDTRLNGYRVFDFDDNTFKVDVGEIVAQHPAAKPSEGGFRVDLALGGSIPRVSAAAGLFRDAATGEAEDIDLQQAFASYVVPLGSGLRLDAGKFVTPHGAEVIEGYDGWNDNATRSFLFGYAIPFTHTGLRGSYTFNPKLAATGMVVNGWDDATDNNRSKSVGAQLALTPNARATIYLNGMLGAERADSESDLRRLLDLVASFKAGRLTATVNLDEGSEEGAVPAVGPRPARTAEWSGEAGYLRFAASDRWALILRGERFRDFDGARTGVPQTLSEVTLTPELRVSPRFILRGDLRVDRSSERVFLHQDRPADHQATFLLNAIASF
jgi:hypothetical protein